MEIYNTNRLYLKGLKRKEAKKIKEQVEKRLSEVEKGSHEHFMCSLILGNLEYIFKFERGNE